MKSSKILHPLKKYVFIIQSIVQQCDSVLKMAKKQVMIEGSKETIMYPFPNSTAVFLLVDCELRIRRSWVERWNQSIIQASIKVNWKQREYYLDGSVNSPQPITNCGINICQNKQTHAQRVLSIPTHGNKEIPIHPTPHQMWEYLLEECFPVKVTDFKNLCQRALMLFAQYFIRTFNVLFFFLQCVLHLYLQKKLGLFFLSLLFNTVVKFFEPTSSSHVAGVQFKARDLLGLE